MPCHWKMPVLNMHTLSSLTIYHNRLNRYGSELFFLLVFVLFLFWCSRTFPLVLSLKVALSSGACCIFKTWMWNVKMQHLFWHRHPLCRCPTSRWLQRISWRSSSPGSPLWTWGQPTLTSAWQWPVFSPSLTAPPPASSVPRLTVSSTFTPSQRKTRSRAHLRRMLTRRAAYICQQGATVPLNACYSLTRVSTQKLLAWHTHWVLTTDAVLINISPCDTLPSVAAAALHNYNSFILQPARRLHPRNKLRLLRKCFLFLNVIIILQLK